MSALRLAARRAAAALACTLAWLWNDHVERSVRERIPATVQAQIANPERKELTWAGFEVAVENPSGRSLGVGVQVDLFDSGGRFIDLCRGYDRPTVGSGETIVTQVWCGIEIPAGAIVVATAEGF